jgi:Flp pilus assembly protein TadD
MDALQAARAAYRAGRIHDALEAAQVAAERRPKDPEAWRLLGAVSRHAGMPAAGDDAFQRAAALSPRRHAAPVRVTRGDFERIVSEARAQLSGDAGRRIAGRQVRVEELPSREDMAAGAPADALVWRSGDALVIYQGNHENRSGSVQELVRLVRRSVAR